MIIIIHCVLWLICAYFRVRLATYIIIIEVAAVERGWQLVAEGMAEASATPGSLASATRP
jgi:hypothetical protein